MKKKYETPTAEKIEIDFMTQVVASGYVPDTKPGNGWGDKNHDHKHWKWVVDHYEWGC